ncbi:MAG: ABC transporter permease [Paludibacter sp.]|nr:ABC transporter permease [Paludibacter sp.]
MKLYIQLAWRNIWRNKRRTIITGASIFFGVVFSTVMTSMQEGSYAQYIKTIVNSYSGHLQVHKAGYTDDKVINNSLEYTPEIQTEIQKIDKITTIAPRLESYALASSSDLTKGVMVLGISPSLEDKITSLSKKMTSGKYLTNGDDGVIIGSSLAKYMQLETGDTLVLLGQGYHGISAAGKFIVKGIIKQPSPELDRTVVYMDVNQCQNFLSAENLVSSIVIMADNNDDVDQIKKQLTSVLGKGFEIKDWKEINRILLTQIESDRASGVIIKGILYLIIAFGIFSTAMMMTLERKKEFGVLIAVGMKKFKLSFMLLAETILIGFLGCLTGIMASLPIVWYYLYNPIRFEGQAAETMTQMGFEPVMSFSIEPSIFYTQAIVILIISLLIGLYPIAHIRKLKISKALRS